MARTGQVAFLLLVMAALYYSGAGPVGIFGLVTLLYLGIVHDDAIRHTKELAELIKGHEERVMMNAIDMTRDTKAALKNLEREIETMSMQVQSMGVEMQLSRQSATSEQQRGPRKA